jgi:hypothetical protein
MSQWFVPSSSKLGERIITNCRHCGQLYSNGKKEWLQMTKGEKTREIFIVISNSIIYGILFGGCSSIVVFGFIFEMIHDNELIVIALAIACSLLITFFLATIYIKEVKESIERTENA